MKRSLLTGIIDRAHLDEVDIGDFNTLGAKKKPEAPKVRGCWRTDSASGHARDRV